MRMNGISCQGLSRHFPESARYTAQDRKGYIRSFAQDPFECLPVNRQPTYICLCRKGRGAWCGFDDRHLTDEITGTALRQYLLDSVGGPQDLQATRDDHEHHISLFPLMKDDCVLRIPFFTGDLCDEF